MEIFHYCAEILKGTSLFETCRNEELLRRRQTGALYNDFDGISNTLIKDSDFIEEETTENAQASSSISEEIISQCEIDEMFLRADEEDEERWNKDHPLFTSEPGIQFNKCLQELISMEDEEWDELPIYDDDIKR